MNALFANGVRRAGGPILRQMRGTGLLLAVRLLLLAPALVALPGWAGAQEARPAGEGSVIRGMALDSTTLLPLSGALVGLAGGAGTLTADSLGEFRFEAVPPGDYPIVVSHPRLDSLGLTPILRVVTVEAGRDVDVVFATPSVETLRPVYCGSDPASAAGPAEAAGAGGILTGAVVDLSTEVPQPQATVRARWVDARGEVREVSTVTDRGGVFTFCDLPRERPVTLQTVFLGGVRGEDVALVGPGGLLLRDLPIELTEGEARGGKILGTVADADTGAPIRAAVVRLQDTEFETVSGDDGRFIFPEVPRGPYTLEVEHLAYGTQTQEIALGALTLEVDARFSQRAIQLEGIGITVTAREPRLERMGYYDRRQTLSGIADFVEGKELVQRSRVSLATALSTSRGVRVQYVQSVTGFLNPQLVSTRGGVGIGQNACPLRMIVDGMPLEADYNLENFLPQQVAAVEIYPSDQSMPQHYRSMGGGADFCGALVIWTGAIPDAGPVAEPGR